MRGMLLFLVAFVLVSGCLGGDGEVEPNVVEADKIVASDESEIRVVDYLLPEHIQAKFVDMEDNVYIGDIKDIMTMTYASPYVILEADAPTVVDLRVYRGQETLYQDKIQLEAGQRKLSLEKNGKMIEPLSGVLTVGFEIRDLDGGLIDKKEQWVPTGEIPEVEITLENINVTTPLCGGDPCLLVTLSGLSNEEFLINPRAEDYTISYNRYSVTGDPMGLWPLSLGSRRGEDNYIAGLEIRNKKLCFIRVEGEIVTGFFNEFIPGHYDLGRGPRMTDGNCLMNLTTQGIVTLMERGETLRNSYGPGSTKTNPLRHGASYDFLRLEPDIVITPRFALEEKTSVEISLKATADNANELPVNIICTSWGGKAYYDESASCKVLN